MALDVRTKRVYDEAESGDGHRVLIDHVWPRGISRERARLDEWARELAPSDELRKWSDHVPERFDEFRGRYRAELAWSRAAYTIVTGPFFSRGRPARRPGPHGHNNAVVVAELVCDG